MRETCELPPWRRFTPLFGLMCAGLICVIAGSAYVAHSDEPQRTSTAPEFQGWAKPAIALVITGQQRGYLEPCGCTGLANQKGGLARRDTLLDQLQRERGWNIVPLDAGCQVRRTGPQAAIKFQTTIQALRTLKYQAVGLGDDDLRLPFGDLLSAVTSATDDQGRSDLFVCANLDILDAEFIRNYKVIESGNLKIGVTAIIGPQALANVTQSDVEKRDPTTALRETVAQIKQDQCQFCVVLAQATEEECQQLAQAVRGIDLIVSSAGFGEPKYQAEQIAGTKTALIQTGVKGMYVGVVGLYLGQRPGIRYQRVPLDNRFADSRRMLDVLKDYQGVLQQQGLKNLGLKPVRHPSGKFVGSEKCGECHTQAYAKWQETPHAHATESLVRPAERSEIPRHFDPECLSCHVTGWNPQEFFPYETGYVDLTASAHLHGNGCENCHGPGLAHTAAENGEGDPTDELKLKLRAQMRLELAKAEQKCLECHDVDNSPDFHSHEGAFQEYWEQIKHPGRD